MNTVPMLLKYFSYTGVSNLTKLEFVVLNALSLGAYSVYWAWAAWETVRIKEKSSYKIRPSMRAIALPLSSFWLLPKISKISKYNLHPYLLAVVYLLFVCSSTFWISLVPTQYLKAFIACIITGLIEALLLLPAFEAQRRASKGVKSTGNNGPLVWFLFVLFVICLPSIFIST